MSKLSRPVRRVIAAWSLNRAPSPLLVLLFLICLLLPTQLGRHFWPDWSYVAGLRSDYLSPIFYLTDILIAWLTIYLLVQTVLKKLIGTPLNFKISSGQLRYLTLSIGLLAASLLSLLGAANLPVGLWHVVKLIEFIIWGLIVSQALSNNATRLYMVAGFLVGSLLQAILGLTQFIKGGSIGLWFLGERTFNDATLGISQADLGGRLVLRSYGTLPHPNVLGIWLCVAAVISWDIFWRTKNSWRLLLLILTAVFIAATLTTLSRTAIILEFSGLLIITSFHYQRIWARLVLVALTLLIAVGLLIPNPILDRFTSLSDNDAQTISVRLQLSQISLDLTKAHPLFGVGLGNFVASLNPPPRLKGVPLLQPAHNIYLLAVAETGIIGLFFLLGLVAESLRRAARLARPLPLILVTVIITAGLVDHYFWTLQQGGLLWWSIIGGLFSQMVEPGVTPVRRPRQRS